MKKFLILIVLLNPVLSISFIQISTATTYVVNSEVDQDDVNPGDKKCMTADGECTLRASISEANSDVEVDIIMVPEGNYSLTGEEGEDENQQGDLDITTEIEINGVNARTTILRGPPTDRVIHVLPGAKLTLKGVTVRDGYITTGDGAGIFNDGGELVVESSHITENVLGDNFDFNGGGVATINGSTEIINSTLSENDAGVQLGGGVYLKGGDVKIDQTTISNNKASNGGGISITTGETEVTNSTIVLNQVISQGGGIRGSIPFIIKNSIVAKNTGDPSDCKDLWTIHGYNLLGIRCLILEHTPTDLFGDKETPLDPMLGPLKNNGGPTDTHAPLEGSPVIGMGGDCGDIDQRGFRRDQPCNIGAFQFSCGDGLRQADEACDDGNNINGDGCDEGCIISACGNGIVAPNETCDDGNVLDGDGCSSQCQIEGAEDENDPSNTTTGDASGGCQLNTKKTDFIMSAFLLILAIFFVNIKVRKEIC